jgi:class 3 adenylate cyclase
MVRARLVPGERCGRPAPSRTTTRTTTSTCPFAMVTEPSRRGRAELPSGTVTFLFTDIEGSTQLLTRLGGGYAEVLGEHRRVLARRSTRTTVARPDPRGANEQPASAERTVGPEVSAPAACGCSLGADARDVTGAIRLPPARRVAPFRHQQPTQDRSPGPPPGHPSGAYAPA